MTTLIDELQQLRELDPDIGLILDSFQALDRIHQEALKAMGQTYKVVPLVKNSAQVTLTAQPSSTANHLFTKSGA